MHAKHVKRKSSNTTINAPAYFNEELVFEREIRPLMEQIQAIAIAHGMPFAMAVGYGRDPDTGYATGSTVCTVEGRTGAELYIAAKMLSKAAFAELVLELLGNAGDVVALSLGDTAPAQRVM
jgi:hypothetical protein